MAQFFQGGGVAYDQGQKLQDAAKQVALLAQQKRQLDQAQQGIELQKMNDMFAQLVAEAKAANTPLENYVRGAGVGAWNEFVRQKMKVEGSGATGLRKLVGAGPTDAAVQERAAQLGSVQNISPTAALQGLLAEGFRRGITPYGSDSIAVQKQAQISNAPQTQPESIVAPPTVTQAQTPVMPQLDPATSTALKRQETSTKMAIDDLEVRRRQAKTQEMAASLDKQIADKEVYLQGIQSQLYGSASPISSPDRGPTTATTIEKPAETKPSFREYLRQNGVQGLSATGTPEKDQALITNNPKMYEKYQAWNGAKATPAEKKVDVAAQKANEAVQTYTERVSRRELTNQGPSAGEKFHEKVAKNATASWVDAVRSASNDELKALIKERKDWLASASQVELEAYGLSEIASTKNRQDTLEAQVELAYLDRQIKKQAEDSKIDEKVYEQYNKALTARNDALKIATDAWQASDMKKQSFENFLAANKTYLNNINAADKNYAEVTKIPQQLLKSARRAPTLFDWNLFGKETAVEGEMYVPGGASMLTPSIQAPTSPQGQDLSKYRNIANK